MKLNHLLLLSALFAATLLSGCKKDDDTDTYTIPETYTFTDESGASTVDFSGQTARLNQLSEIVTYIKTANTTGTALDAQKLKDMYANTGDNGNGHFSFTASGKQLKNKTFEPDQALFESWLDALATASASSTAGSAGVAGVVTSNDGTKKYLLDASGYELGQLIEKGLMGAVFYYQATSVYLGDDKLNVDNTTVVDGKNYTTLEHHWDEAFGYFTDATNFPASGTDRFWGKYANSRNSVLGCNDKIMDAFIEGRAAIANNDLDKIPTLVATIRAEWEKVVVATAISYLKSAKADFADDALRAHQLSEAAGFIMSLKYNVDKNITNTQIDNVLDLIGDDLYQMTTAGIDSAKTELVTIYGLQSLEGQL